MWTYQTGDSAQQMVLAIWACGRHSTFDQVERLGIVMQSMHATHCDASEFSPGAMPPVKWFRRTLALACDQCCTAMRYLRLGGVLRVPSWVSWWSRALWRATVL